MKWYFLIFLVFCIIVSILLSLTYPLKFEEVQTMVPEEELNQINCTIKPWFSIRAQKYNPWHDCDFVQNMGVDCSEWDFDKYTYIICRGYELKSIAFTPLKLNFKSDLQIEYIGITEFDEVFSNCIYVYRIKRLNIDFKYDEIAAYSIFGNSTAEELLQALHWDNQGTVSVKTEPKKK